MASRRRLPDGGWEIRYGRRTKRADGRRAVRVGDCTARQATQAATHIQHLHEAHLDDLPISSRTLAWLETLSNEVHGRLSNHGLCEARVIAGEKSDWFAQQSRAIQKKIVEVGLRDEAAFYSSPCQTVGHLCGHFLVWKFAIKGCSEGSLIKYRSMTRKLCKFLGRDRYLSQITPALMLDWFSWLEQEGGENKKGLFGFPIAPTTRSRLVRYAKDMFSRAVDSGWIDAGQFHRMFSRAPKDVRTNVKRQFTVEADTMQLIIKHAKNNEQKLIFAIGRWMMVRMPSELLPITWDCIDWKAEKMLLRSPKQKKHEWKHERWTPIFPEVMPYLQQQWDDLPVGERGGYVIRRHRCKASDTSLHAGLLKRAAERAGLVQRDETPWPKIWINCKSTRATELRLEYPTDQVNYWANHREDTSRLHYQQMGQWEAFEWRK